MCKNTNFRMCVNYTLFCKTTHFVQYQSSFFHVSIGKFYTWLIFLHNQRLWWLWQIWSMQGAQTLMCLRNPKLVHIGVQNLAHSVNSLCVKRDFHLVWVGWIFLLLTIWSHHAVAAGIWNRLVIASESVAPCFVIVVKHFLRAQVHLGRLLLMAVW